MVCRPVQREEEKKTPVKIDALKYNCLCLNGETNHEITRSSNAQEHKHER